MEQLANLFKKEKCIASNGADGDCKIPSKAQCMDCKGNFCQQHLTKPFTWADRDQNDYLCRYTQTELESLILCKSCHAEIKFSWKITQIAKFLSRQGQQRLDEHIKEDSWPEYLKRSLGFLYSIAEKVPLGSVGTAVKIASSITWAHQNYGGLIDDLLGSGAVTSLSEAAQRIWAVRDAQLEELQTLKNKLEQDEKSAPSNSNSNSNTSLTKNNTNNDSDLENTSTPDEATDDVGINRLDSTAQLAQQKQKAAAETEIGGIRTSLDLLINIYYNSTASHAERGNNPTLEAQMYVHLQKKCPKTPLKAP